MRGALVFAWLALFGLAAFPAAAQDAPEGAAEPSDVVDNAMILLGEPEGAPRQGAALDQMVHEVASRMRCPVCQGLSVEASHTDTAIAMKAEARQLLAAGFSQEQTLSYFEASYGEFIRLEPKAQGFNLLVWIAPVALVVFGAAIIAVRVRRRRPAPSAQSGPDSEQDEDPELAAYLEKVREDVGATLRREPT